MIVNASASLPVPLFHELIQVFKEKLVFPG